MLSAARWFRERFSSRIFHKLAAIHIIVYLSSILIVGNVVSARLIGRIEADTLARRGAAVTEIGDRVEEIYESVRQFVIRFHFADQRTGAPAQIIASIGPTGAASPAEEVFLRSFLDSFVANNEAIIDAIVVDAVGRAQLHSSGRQSRTLVADYNFSSYILGLPSASAGDGLRVFRDSRPAYILRREDPVLTFAADILDPAGFPLSRRVGTLLVNVPIDFLDDLYRDMGGRELGIFRLASVDGRSLFAGGAAETEPAIAADGEVASSSRTLTASGLTVSIYGDRARLSAEVAGLRNQMLFLFSAASLVMLLFTVAVSSVFSRRIGVIVRSMERVESGDLSVRVEDPHPDELGFLSRSFDRMCARLAGFIDREYRYRLKTQHAELEALQERINPHFLYNTLEIIRMRAIREGRSSAAEMIAALGKLFRWNIGGHDRTVSLEDEFEHARLYIAIVNLGRDDNPIAIELDAEERDLELSVPKLVLQPIAENCVVHAFAESILSPRIRVVARRDAELLRVEVADNGVGMSSDATRGLHEALSSGAREERRIGLANVHERIRLLYGEAYGVEIASVPDEGTRVTLTLPCIEPDGR